MNKYRRARERAGFTQKELSALIGVEASVLSRYELDGEANKINPPEERKRAIADFCGISYEFLEDESPSMMELLSVEQKARFTEIVKHLDRVINKPHILCGNPHPFRYLVKARWIPIVQDAAYIDRFRDILPNSNSTYILMGSTDSEPDLTLAGSKEADEFLNEKLRDNEKNTLMRTVLHSDETRIIEENGEKHLFLNIDDIDPEIQQALLILVRTSKKASEKGLTFKPVKQKPNLYDVWQDAAEAPDEPFSSAFTIGTDLSLEEAEKFVDGYNPEKENPPQNPEDPEAE